MHFMSRLAVNVLLCARKLSNNPFCVVLESEERKRERERGRESEG